jgi:acetoin utilization deacetylase AcuC-like enzyme
MVPDQATNHQPTAATRRETLRTGLVIDPRYQDHLTGAGHPERPARISTLLEAVDGLDRAGLERVEPRAASHEELALVHTEHHIGRVAATASRPAFAFDADTPTSAQSYDTALLAAGGLLDLLDRIMDGDIDNGCALVRPPGHHAEPDRAMGFCLFNNVAIGARYLQARHGIRRVAIVDWDVHHGNGTEHAFEADPSVLYISSHQYPYYPGSGAAHDSGAGDGEGFTVNLPMPAGCGDPHYLQLFDRVVDSICRQFDPEFVLVSAGFDAHLEDPLAAMRVTDDGYAAMARSLLRIASEHCGGRFAAVLEGGYDLDALRSSVMRVLEEMDGRRLAEPLPAGGGADRLVALIWSVQDRYWRRP